MDGWHLGMENAPESLLESWFSYYPSALSVFLFRGSQMDSSLGSGLKGTPFSSRANATPLLGPPLWARWYVSPVAAVQSNDSTGVADLR